MKNFKVLQSQLDRLVTLLDEHEDIFFAERPWLEDPSLPKDEDNKRPPIIPDERRSENELKIKKTAEAINKELGIEVPAKTSEPIQTGIPTIS